ncbi:unnamed protein product, partial [Gulo gulo]
ALVWLGWLTEQPQRRRRAHLPGPGSVLSVGEEAWEEMVLPEVRVWSCHPAMTPAPDFPSYYSLVFSWEMSPTLCFHCVLLCSSQ